MVKKNSFALKRTVAENDLEPNGLIALSTKEYAQRFHLSAYGVFRRIHRRKVLATKNFGRWKIIILKDSKDGLGIPYYVPRGVNRNQ
jgi:hypothetical protein